MCVCVYVCFCNYYSWLRLKFGNKNRKKSNRFLPKCNDDGDGAEDDDVGIRSFALFAFHFISFFRYTPKFADLVVVCYLVLLWPCLSTLGFGRV